MDSAAIGTAVSSAPLHEAHPAGGVVAPTPLGLVPRSGGNTSVTTSFWPGFAGAGNQSGQAASAAPPTNRTLWSVYTGAQATSPSGISAAASPAVAYGTVYEGTGSAGGVVALNATTGALVWSTELPFRLPVYGSLLVADHIVFAPGWSSPINGSGALFALNASDGNLLWSASLGVAGPLLAPPNLVDGVVVDADASIGDAYGWSERGTPLYRTPLLTPPLTEPVDRPISVLSPAQPLALAVAGPYLVAYNATNGAPYGGVSWSPFLLASPSNGSASQTDYVWQPTGPTGSSSNVALAILGENAGPTTPSEVVVLATLGVPGHPALGTPVVASWTAPSGGEGFVGTPTVLGQRGSNLTFALVQLNGTIVVFHFALNSTGAGVLAPREFIPWTSSLYPGIPAGSMVGTGGPGGELLLGSPDGQVEAISVASRSVLWDLNTTAPVLSSPALANAQLFVANERGVLRAIGGPSVPPLEPRLLLSVSAPPWIKALDQVNISVGVKLWYPNGTIVPANASTVTMAAQAGNVTGSPALTSPRGVANFTYDAPSVSREINATLFVNATWGSIRNGTSVTVVVVPPRLVNNTPLSILADPVPPPSIRAGQAIPIAFTATVGPGGPALDGAFVQFTAFGGTSYVAYGYTNASGMVNTTFVASKSSTGTATAGLTVTVEKAGYELGTYSWVTEVNPLALLVLSFTPASLLVLTNATEAVDVVVNSTAGVPVQNAVVSLVPPSLGGNLSTPGGLTDARGTLAVTYTAPAHVSPPGLAGFIQVRVTASGYTTVNGEVPVTVVPNGTASSPGSQGPSSSNPLAGLSAGEAWGVLALLGLLVLVVLLLMLRRPRPPRAKPSVWEEWEPEKEPSRGRAGWTASGEKGALTGRGEAKEESSPEAPPREGAPPSLRPSSGKPSPPGPSAEPERPEQGTADDL